MTFQKNVGKVFEVDNKYYYILRIFNRDFYEVAEIEFTNDGWHTINRGFLPSIKLKNLISLQL